MSRARAAVLIGIDFNQFAHPHQRFEHTLDSRWPYAKSLADISRAKNYWTRPEHGQDFA
jgi:hypothetical protein